MALMLSPKATSQAKWNDINTEIFLKVCVEKIDAGNRPHTHFTKEGWTNILDKFNKQTGLNYEKKQMKNGWDNLKQEFGMWARMVEKETGLGWDSIKQTVIAPDEWWAAKGRENPKYLHWKNQGPKCLDLLHKCFKDVVATGFYVYEPPTNPPSYEEPNDQDVNYDETLATEGEGGIGDQHLDDINEGPSTAFNFQKKRKRAGKDKTLGAAQKLQSSLDRIVQSIDEQSQTTEITKEDDEYSIPRCVYLLNDVPGLERGSPTYLMAMCVLLNRGNRQLFVASMKSAPETIIPWLSTFTFDDVKHYK